MYFYINIPLPEPLLERVLTFEKRWQGDGSSEPHITLVAPRLLPENITEDECLFRVESVLSNIKPFSIELDGTDYFDDKYTIFLKVQKSSDFLVCHQKLNHTVGDLIKTLDDQLCYEFNPHITLATRLSPEHREMAWQEANQLQWENEFQINKLRLLRKMPGNKCWTVIREFISVLIVCGFSSLI